MLGRASQSRGRISSCRMKSLPSPYLGVRFYSFSLNYPSGHQKGGGTQQLLLWLATSFLPSEHCHCDSNREGPTMEEGRALCTWPPSLWAAIVSDI